MCSGIRHKKCTVVLLAVLLVVFILDFFVLVKPNTQVFSVIHLVYGNNWGMLTEWGRLLNVNDIGSQWWRLLTTIFLHAGIPHLIVNMITLFIVGTVIESKIGSTKFLLVFILSGVASAIVTMYFANSAVGASGAIFGIIGSMIVIMIKDKKHIRSNMSIIELIFLIAYIVFVNLSGIPSFVAHIAGLIFGIIISSVMVKKPVE